MKYMVNRVGIQYNRLLVKEFASIDWDGYHFINLWKCKCDCGKETIVRGGDLQSGKVKSCGCLQQEKSCEIMSKRIGKKNPNYKNGENCGKNTKAIRELKEEIRKRDNYTCQYCGKTQEQNLKETGRILDVHHIDGDDTNNVEENMISLCWNCHRKTIKYH